MKRRMTGVFAALLLAASVSSADATVINSGGFWGSVSSFGEGGHTFGQTFSLNPGNDTSLDSVSFYLYDFNNPDNIDYALYIYGWDGAKITGSSLFTSGMLSSDGLTGWETVSVNTGGVNLTTGTDYIFFVSASNFYDGSYGTGALGATNSSYANGNFFYSYNGNDFGMLSNTAWSSIGSDYDLAFTLQLSPSSQVPEPSTLLLLLGGGLAGLGVVRRLRKG